MLVPSRNTQHIQEAHDVVVHVICELVEQRLAAAGWFQHPGAVSSPSPEPGGRAAPSRERAVAHSNPTGTPA